MGSLFKKQQVLWAFFVALALTALLGITALYSGLDEWTFKILATSATISLGSLLLLPSAALHEQKRWRGFSAVGMLSAISATGLAVFAYWAEIQNESYFKLTMSAWVLAWAMAHAAVLFHARLAPRFHWCLFLAIASIALLAGQLLLLIWLPDFEPSVEFIGSSMILVALFTLGVPIFHRMSSIKNKEPGNADGTQ